MSLHLEMLQVARLARRVLGESTPLVGDFLQRQQNADGGFRDRAGSSDLYYTVFALDGLSALAPGALLSPGGRTTFSIETTPFADSVTAAAEYLKRFGAGDGLDLIHLSGLVRAQATLAYWGCGSRWASADFARRLESFRCADGGYHVQGGAAYGTAYAAFLALGAYEDLGLPLPDATRLAYSLAALATPDGAWANERLVREAATNPTAAAVAVLRRLGQMPAPRVADWLRAQFCAQGGFRAGPGTPFPDLLSTATALHSLASLGADFRDLREQCLDFVDSLWTNEGSFHAHWLESQLDAEYTFYGLLALGHLASVQS